MKKTIIYTSGLVALIISTVFSVVINNATATESETHQVALTTNTELGQQSINKLDPKNQTVYIITNSDGTINKSFVGSQLNNSSEPMPLEQHIIYNLDGQEITAEELVGKSGHIKITFVYNATKIYQNKLVPFLVAAGFTLDDAKFKNVKIDNGKVLSESDNIIVAGYCFAGLNEDLNTDLLPNNFTVTADVTNFTLDNVYSFATNEIFAEIDTSKLDSIDSLIGSINDLSNGLDRIISGSNDLSNGLSSALTGATKLQSGAIQLETGASTLANGATKLSNSTAELSAGINEVNTGATTIAEKTTTLSNGLQQLSENSESLRQGAKSVFNNLLTNTKSTISNNTTLMNIIDAYSIPFPLTIENYNSSLTALINAVTAGGGDTSQLIGLKDSLDNYNQFYTGILSYTKTVDLIANQIPALSEGTAALANGTNKLNSGASILANGAKDLASGTNSLSSGTAELRFGIDSLTSGILQLGNGSKTLTAGLITFKQQGINRLVDFANNDLDNFVRNFRATVTAADSYRHYGNSNATSVKFIFKSPSIK